MNWYCKAGRLALPLLPTQFGRFTAMIASNLKLFLVLFTSSDSVTRLGDFVKFLGTIFLTAVAQTSGNFLGNCEKHFFFNSNLLWLLFGHTELSSGLYGPFARFSKNPSFTETSVDRNKRTHVGQNLIRKPIPATGRSSSVDLSAPTFCGAGFESLTHHLCFFPFIQSTFVLYLSLR